MALFRKFKVTQTDIAPTSQPSVSVVDVGTETQERTGSITIVGAGGLVTRRGGGGGTITQVTNVPIETAEKLTGAQATEQTQVIATSDITPEQRQAVLQSRQTPQQFTGVVEKRDVRGKLEQRQFIRKGVVVAEESKFTGQPLQERKGKPTRFEVVRDKGRVTEIRETREEETPVTITTAELPPVQVGAMDTKTFTEKIADAIATSKFGGTRSGQNVVLRLRQIERIDKPLNKEISKTYEFERTASLKEVYKSGKGNNFPAVVRSVFAKGGTKVEKGLLKVGAEPLTATIVSRTLSSVALGTFLLAPTSPTTSSIERQLYAPSRVSLTGVTQKTGVTKTGYQKVTTQASFRVTRAGKSVKGFIDVRSVQNQAVSISKAKGQTFTSYPTARGVNTKSNFKAVEISKVTQRQGLIFSRGVGTIKQTGVKLERFTSEGVSKSYALKNQRYLAQIGATQSQRGGASFSTGILKVRQSPQATSFRVSNNLFSRLFTSKRGQVSVFQPRTTIRETITTRQRGFGLREQSLISTKNIVGASIKLPVTSPLQAIPFLFTPQRQQTTRKISFTPQYVTRTERQQVTPVFFSGGTDSLITRTRTSGAQAFETAQTQTPKLTQTPIQKQTQSQSQIFKTITLQEQRTRLTTFRIPIQARVTPKVFLRFPKGKATLGLPRGSVKLFVKEKGLFRFKGAFPTPRQATISGVNITQRSISRSFKISGGKAFLPKGYRYSRRQKNVFVELSKTALSQRGEQYAVQFARYNKRSVF